MSIQSNINQSLAITGALLSQTPLAEATKEKAALTREEEGLTAQWHGLESQERTFKELVEKNRASLEDINYYQQQVAPKMFSTGQRLNEVRAKLDPETASREIAKGYKRGVGQYEFKTKLDRLARQLSASANNNMPKREDNVDRFYKELGGKK